MLIEEASSYEVEMRCGPLETTYYFYEDFKSAYYCYLNYAGTDDWTDVKIIDSKRKTYVEKIVLKK